MNVEDYEVEEENDEPDLVTCANGCPEGALGSHKFSCRWAGRVLFLDGYAVRVTGEGPEGTVCVEDSRSRHQHVHQGRLANTRYGEVKVQLTRTDGNVFALMDKVQDALRRNGHADREEEFAQDIMSAESYNDALQRMQRWVNVS